MSIRPLAYLRVALVGVLLGTLVAGGGSTTLAQGGTVSGNKTLGATDIQCGGSTTVTLSLAAEPGIAGNPADIMLVLDRSGSMSGQPLADLKVAAKAFVDIIDQATDGAINGTIALGSRIGVVSFADSASLDVGLTSNANAVKSAIDALSAGGNTNHEAAISLAQAQLAGGAARDIMIIFTDGQTTAGGDPDDDAAAARAAGTEIFAIGLGNVNVGQLNDWATDPDATHVFVTPSSAELEQIFQAIGAAITVPGATNIKVVDTVSDHFSVSGQVASKGAVAKLGNVLTWTIDKLAEFSPENATLTYTATHDNTKPGGVEQVNVSVTYSDAEGHTVTFPNPSVNVRGCAASLDLTPATATNEFSGVPGQTHEVTATVLDSFGDPVANVTVDFAVISGPNAGAPMVSDTTDASGEADSSYSTIKAGLAGLGTDTIQATAAVQSNVSVKLTDTATKRWVDTTPPVAACLETVNPHGNTIPPAGKTTLPGPKGGQNEDGFYKLTVSDAVDPNPQIFVLDTGSGTVFGPYSNGTNIKYTEAPDATPSSKPIGSDNGQAGAIDVHIIGTGDAAVYAVDASGNQSVPVACLVPPPPK